jgi:hypothetical protein
MVFQTNPKFNELPQNTTSVAPNVVGPVHVLQPNGGETWKVGAAQTIMWSVAHQPVIPASVWLSADAGRFWFQIGIDYLYRNTFTGKPSGFYVTDRALVKVCMLKMTGYVCNTSDATFSIKE